MSIVVLDNILPSRLKDEVQHSFEHVDTPWRYSAGTYASDGEDINLRINELEEPQYVHMAFYEGEATYLWPLMNSLLYFVEKELNARITTIQRCKVNVLTLSPYYDPIKNHPVHPDRKDAGWYSAIYYITDGDGDTVFTDVTYPNLEGTSLNYEIVKRVSPKKGRFVIFPSNVYHASSPTTCKRRIVANYVFRLKEDIKV
jgi:hypothetical protein